MLDAHHIFGTLAAFFAVAATVPYVLTTVRGQTRPHVLSWAIWVILNVIAFFAQVTAGAGPGAWVTAASGIMAVIVTVLAWRKMHDITIYPSDWIAFSLAIIGLVLWKVTDEPLAAAILVTLANLLAYVPTARKAWSRPETENALAFFFHLSKCLCGLLAMQDFNWTTALYPAALACGNLMMVGLICLRRTQLKK